MNLDTSVNHITKCIVVLDELAFDGNEIAYNAVSDMIESLLSTRARQNMALLDWAGAKSAKQQYANDTAYLRKKYEECKQHWASNGGMFS